MDNDPKYIFERSRISLEIKLIVALYLLSSSLRRIALPFSVGKSIVHYWIDKFEDVLESSEKEKVRKLVIARLAVDDNSTNYAKSMKESLTIS